MSTPPATSAPAARMEVTAAHLNRLRTLIDEPPPGRRGNGSGYSFARVVSRMPPRNGQEFTPGLKTSVLAPAPYTMLLAVLTLAVLTLRLVLTLTSVDALSVDALSATSPSRHPRTPGPSVGSPGRAGVHGATTAGRTAPSSNWSASARRCGRASAVIAVLGQRDGATQRRTGERDVDQRAVERQGDGRDHGSTEAGPHEREDARHLAPLAHQMRLDAGSQTGGQGHLAEVVALAEHDEVETVEVAHLDPAPAGQAGDPGASGQHQGIVEELAWSPPGDRSPAAPRGRGRPRPRRPGAPARGEPASSHRQVDARRGSGGRRPGRAPSTLVIRLGVAPTASRPPGHAREGPGLGSRSPRRRPAPAG